MYRASLERVFTPTRSAKSIHSFFARSSFVCLIFAAATLPAVSSPPPPSSAPATPYRFENWTTRQGLPYKTVRGVLQTADGYLWAATSDGLARFDGLRFTVFNTANAPGLTTNRLEFLAETADGSLWISGEHGGLFRFREGAFSSFSAAAGGGGLPHADLRNLHEARDGTLWIASMSGLELARRIKEKNLPGALVFLTMHKDATVFHAAMALNVKGYVLKDNAVTDITECVAAVAAGSHYIAPALSEYLFSGGGNGNSSNRRNYAAAFSSAVSPGGLDSLTKTERRILRLIAEEKTSKEIGELLFIHSRTVDNHRTNIRQKLDLQGTNSLLRFALLHKEELAG